MIRKYSKIILIGLVFIFLLFFSQLAGLYIDWLFFTETGYQGVFQTIVSAQALVGLLFGVCAFLWLFLNIGLTFRTPLPTIDIMFLGMTRITANLGNLNRFFKIIGLVISIVMGIFSAIWGSKVWNQAIIFHNAVYTGIKDPVLNNDIGFYLFRLPMWEIINSFAGFILFMSFCIVALSYILRGSLMFNRNRVFMGELAKKHLAALGGLFILKIAFGFYLDTFGLLYSQHGVIFGAGYADINGRLIALYILVVAAIITAVLFSVTVVSGRIKILIYSISALIFIYIVGFAIYPALLQNLRVSPNELAMERPFIEHHIKMTRFGYDLESVKVRPFDVSYNLTSGDIMKNQTTINNIRLWDEAPLYKTFAQLQQIRTYYKFNSIDDDRYMINNRYQQVMLSARELSYGDLPSKSWINEKFVFTHGNGVAMSYVNRITKEGLPEFLIRDIPPVSIVDLKITRPEIYYGEIVQDYVVARTKIPEFSYPTSEGNKYTSYEGTGGVRLDSFFKKAVFAFFFRTAKIVLSSEITPESRLIFYRDVTERIQKIAPFLMLDSDPYIVISKDGKLYWIVDAYTVSSMLPYSKPLKNRVNYMRNSVKAIVDAYNGGVSLFISDPKDPVISVYKKIFPGMFKSMEEMPEDLKAHVRFPRDLFKIQAAMYGTYHMEDPKIFYNKEDLWEIPVHGEKKIEPYYLIMKLPGEKKEEYVLLMPYTPAKRDNLAAWLAARCDNENYGKLVVYTFPRDRLIFGPRQIDARIDQDSYISQQLTLWGQRGSQVIWGRLLIIPIEASLLYIQPLYLAAEDKGGLPELRRVIVAYENDVVMEENLEQCLNRLFGGKKTPITTIDSTRDKASKKDLPELSKEAMKVFEKAKEFQRQGNWAGYGEELKKLEAILKQMTSR